MTNHFDIKNYKYRLSSTDLIKLRDAPSKSPPSDGDVPLAF
jgi:hypothetical protein